MAIIYPFKYYVYVAKSDPPTEFEREQGIYLIGEAEATYLDPVFETLDEEHSIAICRSGDVVIKSMQEFDALDNAIRSAVEDVRGRPAEWPVSVGYSLNPDRLEPGMEIVRIASRERLLEFLEAVRDMIKLARCTDAMIYFCGGG